MPSSARIILGLGVIGLVMAILNQSTAPSLDPPLERASVLAGGLAVVLMLVATLWSRVEPAARGRAPLAGEQGMEICPALPEAVARELAWGSQMLLTATAAAAVLLWWDGTVLLRRGLLEDRPFSPGPTCRRGLERGKPISLVDLSLYPGRSEFDGLLRNLPSVVIQPIGPHGLLLVGGWSARCFRQGDLVWIEGWTRRLTDEWAPALDGAAQAWTERNHAAPGTG
jgi:hypothetical protein